MYANLEWTSDIGNTYYNTFKNMKCDCSTQFPLNAFNNNYDASTTLLMEIDSTGMQNMPGCGTAQPVVATWTFDLPVIPSSYNVKSIYLGVKIRNRDPNSIATSFKSATNGISSNCPSDFVIGLQRWAFSKNEDLLFSDSTQLVAEQSFNSSGSMYQNLPDTYWTSGSVDDYLWPLYGNQWFYVNNDSSTELTGFSNAKFHLTDSLDVYNSYTQGLIMQMLHCSVYESNQHFMDIYALTIIVQLQESTINNGIFTPMAGRIYGDTWGGRKDASACMNNPIDWLEHVKRIECWSENYNETANFGYTYSTSAKINTASFDSTFLNPVKDMTTAFIQYTDQKQASDISKDICSTYFLTNYIDSSGNECVYPIFNTSTPVDATIQYSDCFDRVGKITEADPQYTYCLPIVNYGYNGGDNTNLYSLGMVNVQQNTFSQSDMTLTVGFQSFADASAVYRDCHNLFVKYGNIDVPSSDYTDKKMIQSYPDALWYLQTWVWWMKTHQRRMEVTCSYEYGSGWFPGMLIALNLPHQTNGVPKLCRVESVKRSKYKNTTTFGLILIDD